MLFTLNTQAENAVGLTKAIDARWPKSLRIRCWFHKMQNLEQKVPEQAWPAFQALVTARRAAPSRKQAEERRAQLVARYQRECPQACRWVWDDTEASLTHLELPQRPQQYVRTSNLVERAFVAERRRTPVIPHRHDERSLVQLVFAGWMRVSHQWNKKSFSGFEQQHLRNLRRNRQLDEQEVRLTEMPSDTPSRRSAPSAA